MNDDEEILARMLEDLAKVSGMDLGEILADIPEDFSITDPIESGASFFDFPIQEEPTEGAEFDISNTYSDDIDEYFDDLMDDIDVNAAEEEDIYSED